MSEDNTKPKELVMCVHHKAFDNLMEKHGLKVTEACMLLYSMPGCVMMIDRNIVENDPNLLQIVTYTILRAEGKILAYKRGKSGGETRLHERYSIGVGGHVNMNDVMRAITFTAANKQLTDPIWQCMVRELNEELVLTADNDFRVQNIPVIYDDSNEVSTVHAGFANVVDLPTMDHAKAKEDCIEDLQWVTLEELQSPEWQQKLESWSNVAVVSLVEAANLKKVADETMVAANLNPENSDSVKGETSGEEEQLPSES